MVTFDINWKFLLLKERKIRGIVSLLFFFLCSIVSNQQLAQKAAQKVEKMGARTTEATVQRQPHPQLRRPCLWCWCWCLQQCLIISPLLCFIFHHFSVRSQELCVSCLYIFPCLSKSRPDIPGRKKSVGRFILKVSSPPVTQWWWFPI